MPRPTLRRTLIVTFVLVCTAPILALAAWLYPNLRQHTQQIAAERNQAAAQNLASAVNSYLDSARHALHAASVFVAHDDDHEEITELMRRQRYFRMVLVVNAQGVLRRWPNATAMNTAAQDQQLTALAAGVESPGAPRWSGVVRNPYDGDPTMLFTEHTAEGAVVGLLDLGPLIELADRVRIGQRGYAAITDHDGYIVSAANKTWVRQISNVSEWPAVAAALRGKTGSILFEAAPGARYLAGYAPVAEFRWAVLTPQPVAELRAEGDALLRTAAWVGLGSLSLALLLAVGLSCWIARPISALAKTVQRLPNTGYQAEFETLARIAPRELDTLQRRSKQMAREVRNAIALRDRMNDELARLVDRATRGLKDANIRLARQALVDDLTKLGNRRALWQRVSDLEQARPDTYLPVQVLLFDLDNFKEVNDTLGHAIGDQVLTHVAGVLTQATRDGDFVARYGGDEFLVIMHRCTPDIANERADAIREAARSQPLVVGEQSIRIQMSVGIAQSESKLSRPSFDELLKAADRAMYVTKRKTRRHGHLAGIQAGSTPL